MIVDRVHNSFKLFLEHIAMWDASLPLPIRTNIDIRYHIFICIKILSMFIELGTSIKLYMHNLIYYMWLVRSIKSHTMSISFCKFHMRTKPKYNFTSFLWTNYFVFVAKTFLITYLILSYRIFAIFKQN